MDASIRPDESDDSEQQALSKALRFGAMLLVIYSLLTLPLDWHYLLDPERYGIDSAEAIGVLLAGPVDGAHQRLHVLAACVVMSLLVAMGLGLASMLVPGEPARRPAMAIGVIAIATVLLSLPAHLPFVLPHTVAYRPNGDVVTQADYSRAYRDAITYVWSSMLLVTLPIVASGRIDGRIKGAAAALAMASVLLAHFPHAAHKGSRTENELLIFAVVVLTVLHLGTRIQRTLARERAERKRYEEGSLAAIQELRAARERRDSREERRTDFLAAAAHDLRQPLTAVLLYADLLSHAIKHAPLATADAQRHLQVLKAECASLASAFDAILDYSQIETGRIDVKMQAHRLREVFEDLARRFAPLAEQRGLSLRFVAPAEDCVVHTDRALLTRLLSNLLSNAIKYTPALATRKHGTHDVILRTRRRGLLVTLYVIDRGKGIPPQMRERIFEAGVQLDNPERDRQMGFGLGLATVRGIVTRALPNHAVRLNSVVGRGTHLMVDVPLEFGEPLPVVGEPEEATTLNLSHGGLEGALVALIEDDASLREGLAEVLRRAGSYLIEAGGLAEIVRKVEAADRFPDMILSDFRLPEGATGRDVIVAVRQACGGREVPAIVLTADQQAAQAATRELARVEVVRKPINRRELLRRLSEHYDSGPSPLDLPLPLGDPQPSSSATPARAIS